MQLKMGGKFHLKLNIGERPIANKYREGKMKSTLERELINFDRRIKVEGMWHPSGCVIDLNSDTTIGIEELGALRPGCWHNGFKRPVLKHGPRSLTCPRVFGCQTRARNESES